MAELATAREVLETLKPGDLMLLAARPGQGKTVLGLQILLEAIKSGNGNKGFFFSLEYTELDIWHQIKQLGANPASLLNRLEVETSDEINAHLIESRLAENTKPAVVVIDYLQLLDQRRQNPELNVQLQQLANAARKHNAILIALSQVHRSYDLLSKTMPDWSDVKLPNPADLSLFNKGCFLHDGQAQILPAP